MAGPFDYHWSIAGSFWSHYWLEFWLATVAAQRAPSRPAARREQPRAARDYSRYKITEYSSAR